MTPARFWAGTPSSPATWKVASERGRREAKLPVDSACATVAGWSTELTGAAGRAGSVLISAEAESAIAAPRAAATIRTHADRRSMDHLCGTVATALIGLSFRSGCLVGSDGRTVGHRPHAGRCAPTPTRGDVRYTRGPGRRGPQPSGCGMRSNPPSELHRSAARSGPQEMKPALTMSTENR